MKLLAFSDLHLDRERAERLVELAGAADVVVGAGDYATTRTGLDGMIETLSAITVPTVLVPGNAESDTELWRACAVWPSAEVLHGQAKEIEGMECFGLGGAVPPTPFPWSFDLSEDEAAAQLAGCPKRAVLVVHSPPSGSVDEVHGRRLGSTAVLTRSSASARRSSCAATSISAGPRAIWKWSVKPRTGSRRSRSLERPPRTSY